MVSTSIIIPTHNRAAMLRRAVESAKSAGRDVEVIVVDDASEDETPSMCLNLPDINYIRLEQNSGPSQARNIGIARSTGKFLAFLDDDDLRLEGSIDKQARILEQNSDLGFVYGQVHIGDNETCTPTGKIRPHNCPTGDLFLNFLQENHIYMPSVLVRRSAMENVGLFDTDRGIIEDWDMWIRLAEKYPVGAQEYPVAIYRDFTPNSNQASSNMPKASRAALRSLEKALNYPRARGLDYRKRMEIRDACLNRLWNYLVIEGRRALSAGRYRYAAANYLTALRLHPKRAFRPGAVGSFLSDIIR